MARIRTIKPEMWSSPGVSGLDPWARLLFIAMWNWADDTGRGVANPGELAGFAFPNDETITARDIRRMLDGIRRAFGVVFYEVGGRPYFWIPSWEKHQKIDKRSASRYPAPEEGAPWDPDPQSPADKAQRSADLGQQADSAELSGHSADSAEDPPNTRRTSGAGTEEQGNRGTGDFLVPAVGGLTVRTARACETAPAAQPEDLPAQTDSPKRRSTAHGRLAASFAAHKVIQGIPRYRDTKPWFKRHLAELVDVALAAGFGPQAIEGYAVMVITEARFPAHQHIPELRDALRRLSRDAAVGSACRSCGFDPGDCPCSRAAAADRPWTAEDQAALERAMDHLGVTAGELDRGA